MGHRPAVFLIACCLVRPAGAGGAEEQRFWPQWRGPEATGVAPHASPPVSWSESENVAWKLPLPGLGSSTPAVWGERLFLTTAEAGAGDAVRSIVLAVERGTGSVAWRRVVDEQAPHEGKHQDATFASASPITDGAHLWAFFGSRGLYCLTVEGEPVWEKDLGDMRPRRGFGEAASPALHGDVLVVPWDHEGDSFVVALDKRTGEEIWRRGRDEITTWATPLVVEHDGRVQAVLNGTNRVRSYDLETGEEVWTAGGMTVNAIPTPVAGDGVVYVTSGYRGSALLAVDLDRARGDVTGTDAVLWSWERDTPYVPSPLLYRDTLYVLKSNSGILTVFDAKTGEVLHGPARLGVRNVYASPVGADGRVYLAGRDGDTAVLRHGPQPEVIGSNRLDDGFDASPVPVGDTLYLRGRRHLYAIAEPAE